MTDYPAQFQDRLIYIDKLSTVPLRVKEIAVNLFEPHIQGGPGTVSSPLYNALQALKNVDNGQLKQDFAIIYEQSLFLAVSAMSSILERYFTNYAMTNWRHVAESKRASEIKLTIGKLAAHNYSTKGTIGQIIISEDSSVNFQDVQSILRTFKEYCSKEFEIPSELLQKLIFFTQCRHLVAHAGSVVNQQFLDRTAPNSNLKNYTIGDRLEFDKADWEDIKSSFIKFVEIVTKAPVDQD